MKEGNDFMNNQRGGILSKLFAIPIGVALMVGFFFLGYYVGKYQSKSNAEHPSLPVLPDIVSRHLPKHDEYTFYKTLTDKEDKTVSLDLKPKQAAEENRAAKKETGGEAHQDSVAPPKPGKKPEKPAEKKIEKKPEKKGEKQIEIKVEKAPAAQPRQTASTPPPAKKEQAPATAPVVKTRYSLQIASYPEREMADEEVKKMKKRGYAAFVVTSDVPDKGTWYRVRLGSFSNKAAAEKLVNELRTKEGLSPFITVE
jgi:cell division septation protein DedD